MAESIQGARHEWSIAPYFLVDDVVTTADWYRDKLGFRYERLWGDPPVFCMVHRRGVIIMLSQVTGTGAVRPNHVADPEREAWDAYIWTENADVLHEEFAGRGVTISRDICDQPYGMRDFDVEDRNGYRLCFGHNIEGSA